MKDVIIRLMQIDYELESLEDEDWSESYKAVIRASLNKEIDDIMEEYYNGEI
jgi:hypothetical protein